MTVSRKALKGAVKRGLLHKDAVDGPVPEGGPRRWTCLTCGREFRRDQDANPRLFGCGCCSAAWDTFKLRRTVAAGKPALLVGSGVVGMFKTIKRGMAVFIAEGGDTKEIECEEKALAPIYQHKTEHEQPCRHSPMPSGITFKGRTKETPMAVKKFTPKGKAPVGEDVAARLTHIFSTSGGTTAAQAVAQVADLGVSAESSVEQFLAALPKGYALQQRKGEGGAAVYRLAPEQPGAGPGGTQYKEGTGMATKTGVKKAGKKAGKKAMAKAKKPSINGKKAVGETKGDGSNKLTLREFMLTSINGKPLTKDSLLSACEKQFPGRTRAAMASTFSGVVGGNHVRIPEGWRIHAKKENGEISYRSERLGKSV